MAEPLNVAGLAGLSVENPDICTIEASVVTGFEPMAQEEIKVETLCIICITICMHVLYIVYVIYYENIFAVKQGLTGISKLD